MSHNAQLLKVSLEIYSDVLRLNGPSNTLLPLCMKQIKDCAAALIGAGC